MPVVVCEAPKLLSLIKHSSNCPSLRLIITMANSISSEERDAAQQAGLILHTMSDVKVCLLSLSLSLFIIVTGSGGLQEKGRETPVELMVSGRASGTSTSSLSLSISLPARDTGLPGHHLLHQRYHRQSKGSHAD